MSIFRVEIVGGVCAESGGFITLRSDGTPNAIDIAEAR
jgi:hypothetical protein